MPVDEGSDGLGESEAGFDARTRSRNRRRRSDRSDEVDDPGPPPLNPRQVRARRRRRRRQFGTLLFVLVAGGILATAYFAVAGDDDSARRRTSATGTATTTVAPPFIATYKVTTGINVRQAPAHQRRRGRTVVETGREVTVALRDRGRVGHARAEPASTQWLKVFGPWPLGYVSSAFVDIGDDLVTKKIPTCPA